MTEGSLDSHMMCLPSRLGPTLALPSRVVRGVERLRPRVPGSLQ